MVQPGDTVHHDAGGGEIGTGLVDRDEVLGEEGFDQLPANGVGCAVVEIAGAFQQVEVGVDARSAMLELLVGLREPLIECSSLQHDLVQAGLERRRIEVGICRQVKQAVFFDFEFVALLLHPTAKVLLRMAEGAKCLVELSSQCAGEGGGEAEARDAASEFAFEFCRRDVRHRADAVLLAAAKEVVVDATLALDLTEDHPGDASVIAAVAAERQSLQRMVVDAVPLSTFGSFGEDVLDA